MQITSNQFKQAASRKLADPQVQRALRNAKGKLVVSRAKSILELDNFEDIRDAAARIRDFGMQHMDVLLEEWEKNAAAAGTIVHWVESPQDVNALVIEIARNNSVRKIIKSKSMLGEETNLNHALEAAGLDVRETDLGEYIIQQAGETPSHIIAPAVHKSKEDIADLFAEKHQRPRLTDITEMTHEAREILRPHFLDADMGISGANFLVAETGSTMIVTNEGNGRMTTTMPRVHVAIAGIEKIIPTLEDVSLMLRLLTRSATGQSISNYLSFTTGPKRAGDQDGPGEFHVIIVDAGRTRILASEIREALRCIRCGACMNHCPVYHAVGGHAYGSVYPGPMGAVLTPSLAGIDKAGHLPNASTFCGRCEAVCPMRIPLPKMMRHWREKEFEQHLQPKAARAGLGLWAFVARRPRLYRMAVSLGMPILARLAGGKRRFASLPLAGGWTKWRDLPAPEGRTFIEEYAARQKRDAAAGRAKVPA